MIIKIHLLLISGVILLITSTFKIANAQDIGQKYHELKKRANDNPILLNGFINVHGSAYQGFGIDGRGVPYLGRVSAQLHLDVLGIQIGGSVNISSGSTIFNTVLPSYAFAGISPGYKWATLHIGIRSMAMGKYTFNNHSFNGVGFELKPGNWRISSFYGNLRRARAEDLNGIQKLEPIFNRKGFGIKGGYDNTRDAFLLTIFKAWDDPSSLNINSDYFKILPSENVIFSLETAKALTSKLTLKAEYAMSGLTENRSIPQQTVTSILRNFGGLLQTNESTRWNQAVDISLNLNLKKVNLVVQYERIDPGFRTMGALFFLDDLENINLGSKLRMLKNKLLISGKLGLQRNNLGGSNTNHYSRIVGLGTLNYNISKKASLYASASSFKNAVIRSSVQDINTQLIVTELVLNNEDYNLGASYITHSNQKVNGTLQLNFNFAKGVSVVNDQVLSDAKTSSGNLMAYYNLQFSENKWGFVLLAGRQKITLAITKSRNLIAGAGLNKKLIRDKLTLSLNSSISFNKQWINDAFLAQGQLFNAGISVSYQINESMNLLFNSLLLCNSTYDQMDINKRFSELRSNLALTYRFKS